MDRYEQVQTEDLLTFINACFVGTGQAQYYEAAEQQGLSLDFLHSYVQGNYRRLYARCLATGINDFNKAQILFRLLSTGRDTEPADRQQENALIRSALRRLPPQRAYKLFGKLRKAGVNNRRTRAVVRDYVAGRKIHFDAVKYRAQLRPLVKHTHLELDTETAAFLFRGYKERKYNVPLYESFRQAHYQQEAIYELPYSIAVGLATKYSVSRETFLRKIEPRMTAREKLRHQRVGAGSFDPAKVSLTDLAVYFLSLPFGERTSTAELMDVAARNLVQQTPFSAGKVATVLDRSRSSRGTTDAKQRPLALALAVDRFLAVSCQEYRAFWTHSTDDWREVHPVGTSGLAFPLLQALEWKPELVVIVSDGYENAPAGGVREVLRVGQERLKLPPVIHLNPVFEAREFSPRNLSSELPTAALGRAEEIVTAINFARLGAGHLSLKQLEEHLDTRCRELLGD